MCMKPALDRTETERATGRSYDTAEDKESMAVPTVTAAGRLVWTPREIWPDTAESDVQRVCSAPDAPNRTDTEPEATPISEPRTVRVVSRSVAALEGVTAEIGASNVNTPDTVPTRTPDVTTADRSVAFTEPK
eukprot:3093056-Rhodomonas_salina.1